MKRLLVDRLDDLIAPETYATDPDGRLVRFRISPGHEELVVTGDAARVQQLEDMLAALGVETVEQTLCG